MFKIWSIYRSNLDQHLLKSRKYIIKLVIRISVIMGALEVLIRSYDHLRF